MGTPFASLSSKRRFPQHLAMLPSGTRMWRVSASWINNCTWRENERWQALHSKGREPSCSLLCRLRSCLVSIKYMAGEPGAALVAHKGLSQLDTIV